ncbi:MAG TPA: hypothetical protein PK869_03585 [Candidatus Hydrogenedentes bacterium]|nr:hypothetical protein [Candidatus Hydrogenedentota bacterium]
MSNASQIAMEPTTGRAVTLVNRRLSSGLLRHGSMTLADQMIASTTTFATSVMVGRMCLKEDFGLYMLGFNVYTILLTMQASLVCTPYIVRYPTVCKTAIAGLTGSSLLQQLTLSAGVAIAILLTGLSLLAGSASTSMAHMLIALGSAISFLLLRDFVRQVAFAQLSSGTALLLDAFVAFVQLGGIALIGWYGLLNASSAFLIAALACALGATGWYYRCRHQISLDPGAAYRDFRDHWQSTRWLFLSALVWCVSINIYPWLLAAFHSASSTAAWGAALGVVAVINPIVLGVQNILGPKIMHAYANGGAERLRRTVHGASLAYSGALALFSVSMLLIGDALVVTIYGAKYEGSGYLVALLSLNLACGAFGFAFSRGLFALNRARTDFYVNALALGILLIVGVWLARQYGPVGAAIGQLATNAAACVVRVIAFAACTRASFRAVPA